MANENENENAAIDSSALVDNLRGLAGTLRKNARTPRQHSQYSSGLGPENCKNLIDIAESLADKVESLDWTAMEQAQKIVTEISDKIGEAARDYAVDAYTNPGAANALSTLLLLVDVHLKSAVAPDVRSALILYSDIQRIVPKARRQLEAAMSGIADIEGKFATINSAHEAALNLPTTQADLEQALKDVETSRSTMLRLETEAKQLTISSTETKTHLDELVKRADDAMARVDHAYRAATSDGLARSFADKAKKLNQSMYMWAGALVVALAGAVWLGFERFPAILRAITPVPNASLNWGALAVHGLISVLSLGPAIWLAWIATKQIGQRFRLAEDYAYKAALSAAYEGYRTEAAGIDELMKAQLFSIALTRLDEIPLRVVDHDVPGSPMHELLNSQEFRDALGQSPALYKRVTSILRRKKKGPMQDVQPVDAVNPP